MAQKPFQFIALIRLKAKPGNRYRIKAIESDVLWVSRLSAITTLLSPQEIEARWELTPQKRGLWVFPGAYGILTTIFGLLSRWHALPPVEIPVYPNLLRDFKAQLNPELLMAQYGVKINRSLRADQEFESLRPYVQGDNYKHIDWKASARMQQLITRQFQVEHHHNILVCLDISRLMGTVSENISKLDWAIEACLHLSWLADRFEDRLGLLIFSDRVHAWIKPTAKPLQTVLANLYNRQCHIVEPDYQTACLAVMSGQKKRSLVIFLSDFLDAAALEPSFAAFAQLNRKHCSLFIGVEDPMLQQLVQQNEPETALDAARMLVAQDILHRRQMVLQQLRQLGLHALSATPQNLVQKASNAYLQIKFEGGI